ncbi:MAG: hypothetical protein IJF67_09010 [Clostridia bacterium]|nr:hypothetical protein [Clostridia bacterium]
MNKYKLAGLILALILLIGAIIAMQSGSTAVIRWMLPFLTLGLWALTAVDIISYKKGGSGSKAVQSAELMRVISLGVISVLMTFAVIVSLIQ